LRCCDEPKDDSDEDDEVELGVRVRRTPPVDVEGAAVPDLFDDDRLDAAFYK
jgi:hypothetical protein